jgi:hypothetical protein
MLMIVIGKHSLLTELVLKDVKTVVQHRENCFCFPNMLWLLCYQKQEQGVREFIIFPISNGLHIFYPI